VGYTVLDRNPIRTRHSDCGGTLPPSWRERIIGDSWNHSPLSSTKGAVVFGPLSTAYTPWSVHYDESGTSSRHLNTFRRIMGGRSQIHEIIYAEYTVYSYCLL